MLIAAQEESGGEPLAVCVNDCELDRGQDPRQLVVLCFNVQCAFAKMRWADFLDRDSEMGTEVPSITPGLGCATSASNS